MSNNSKLLDKLMAMKGRELFEFLEDRIKQGKTTRSRAKRIYAAWLARRNIITPAMELSEEDIDF